MQKQEEINKLIAELNLTWQRYARAIEQQVDTVPMAALNRDFVATVEELALLGIAENMLLYDDRTMTFSLPVDKVIE